jgi:hypothetical protein
LTTLIGRGESLLRSVQSRVPRDAHCLRPRVVLGLRLREEDQGAPGTYLPTFPPVADTLSALGKASTGVLSIAPTVGPRRADRRAVHGLAHGVVQARGRGLDPCHQTPIGVPVSGVRVTPVATQRVPGDSRFGNAHHHQDCPASDETIEIHTKQEAGRNELEGVTGTTTAGPMRMKTMTTATKGRGNLTRASTSETVPALHTDSRHPSVHLLESAASVPSPEEWP